MQAILNSTAHHHLPQIFNLSEQSLENLITVWEFELHTAESVSCPAAKKKFKKIKISSAHNTPPINQINTRSCLCNLAANHYHLWEKCSILCEVNAAIDRNCNPAIL